MTNEKVKFVSFRSRVMVLGSVLFACLLALPVSYAGALTCMNVTKTCDTVLAGQTNLVTAVVRNCGDVSLLGISVVDDVYGTIGTIASLGSGGIATLTKSVMNTCGSFPNTVTASGTDVSGTPVQESSSSACVVTENPCIEVTKTCDTVLAGQPNLVTAVVKNCGDVRITGISVADDVYGTIGTIALLAPGGIATLTKSVMNTCGSFPNTVTAAGASPCGTPVQGSSSSACVVTENPCIEVTKTCDTVLPGQPNLVTAVVKNCGDVRISGLSIADDVYGTIGTVALLAPGGIATLTKSVMNTCGRFPNTVTAAGASSCGTPVQESSSAVCTVTCPNQPPVAKCKDIVVRAEAACQGTGSVNDGSFDPDGDPISLTELPPGPYLLGAHTVTLTVSDGQVESSCTATVTVVGACPVPVASPGGLAALVASLGLLGGLTLRRLWNRRIQ